MLRLPSATALALLLPTVAFAAGGGDSSPPKPTETTAVCPEGYVYREADNVCVRIKAGIVDDDTLYGAVREYAYAGDYRSATQALDAMSDQTESRVLTYRGFLARKQGDMPGATAAYVAALAADADNLLARSYLGQGLAEAGDMAGARTQLAEIRMRGGRGLWPETSLAAAIETGRGYDY